jgi:hypothetical protein|tara:strand:- start:21149 stop:21460 length:312 start_codon:yes stop_codon:yes gene_type:complete
MIKALKKALRWPSNEHPLMSDAARERALDVIEAHGYRAHFYLPTVGADKDRELWDALETMRLAGFIVTDQSGHLVGKVATARPTSQEIASERRATFRLVETEE